MSPKLIKPFHIGEVKIPYNLVFAPMDGYSDAPFRRIVKEMGVGLVFTEFVHADALIHSNEITRRILEFSENERPIAAQIHGREVKSLVKAAKIIESLGFDILDFNLGCSVRRVTAGGSGAALMRDPERVAEIFQALVAAVSIPVTVKMRSGYNSEMINAVEIAHYAEQAGLKAITLHPRTREQKFTGKSDWNLIREVVSAIKIPVIGNGDVVNVEDFQRMLVTTGCEAVMIGRAALGRPWLFQEIRKEYGDALNTPPEFTPIQTITRHLENMEAFYGSRLGAILARKHIVRYMKGFPGVSRLREHITAMDSIADMIALLSTATQLYQR